MKTEVRKISLSVLLLGLMTNPFVYAQNHKEYKETFNVKGDVTVTINTSYTDVTLETWNKDQVEVMAQIDVEGLSTEEAQDYIENWGFSAKGNSSEIDVQTKGELFHWNTKGASFGPDFPMVLDFDETIVIKMDSLGFDPMPFLPPIPPMPVMPVPPIPPSDFNFDYKRYEKEGDSYLMEWKDKFKKEFDEEWKEEMRVWKEEMEQNKALWDEERQRAQEEREKVKEEHQKIRIEMRNAQEDARQQAREAQRQMRESHIYLLQDGKNVIFKKDGKDIKAKKSIHIKVPKGAKLNLNVNHGELKMAQSLRNIKASLSYTSLLAEVVDGKDTHIEASYAPVQVNRWNEGTLMVNFTDNVNLDYVQNIRMIANSSDVVIGNLSKSATINSSFGDLNVNQLENDFTKLDVNLENADAQFKVPLSGYTIYLNGTRSDFKFPKNWNLKKNISGDRQIWEGKAGDLAVGGQFKVTSSFSDVILEQ